MEPMGDRNVVRVDFGGSPFHIKHTLMAADAVWIDLVKLGRKTRVLPSALKREDVDAWHQGVARGMTLRAVNLGVEVRLFPKRRFPLLMVAGDAEFLLGRRVRGQGDGRIEAEKDQRPA